MKPFVCNGNFAVKIGDSKARGIEVLDLLNEMDLHWASRERSTKERNEILEIAIASYKENTTLAIERKEKSIYYGGSTSWLRNYIRFTYDEFKKEIADDVDYC